ncbi:MAG: methylcobalamin:coenzyme M methyltransferase [candidate division BRC1 bacterium ADurb.BinA364]|nr:MAG: methylcobalamin:coenzyme M methyltransferase [candidate division BRC1 bacterium ADurb.BinA364]
MPPAETMISRERVIRALRREPIDRTPIDMGAFTSSGISAFAYWRLREHLGLPTGDITICDTVQFLAKVDPDILERFHCDLLFLQPPWPASKRWSPRPPFEFSIPAAMNPRLNAEGEWIVEKTLAGGKIGTMRMPPGGYFFDGAWLREDYPGTEEESLAAYAREAERIYKETPFACAYLGLHGFFSGIEQGVRMLLEPAEERERIERSCDAMIERFYRVNEAMGRYIQIVVIGNDMGGQNGPLVRPESIHEFCGPAYTRFCAAVHAHSDIKVLLHNCGSVRAMIPYIVEWGVDAMNPVQISAARMDPAELKREFGDRLVFWGGGCDTQHVLGSESPDGVARNVRHLMGIFKQGGGYVFNAVHNIQGDVPPQNIVAMLETAWEASAV